MAAALKFPEPFMSAEAFKSWPGDGVHRLHQLIDGEPVAMAPTRLPHERLSGRLTTRLNGHLATHRPGCEVVVEPGVQPRVYASHNVRVPDLAVGCEMGNTHYLDAPVVIVEILSPSNWRETREAVRACFSIPSLQDALILHSEAIAAEVFSRTSTGDWPDTPRLFGPGQELVLPSFEFRCPIDALYAGIELPR